MPVEHNRHLPSTASSLCLTILLPKVNDKATMSSSKPQNSCYPNGHANDPCPNCGQPMQAVDYYSARPLSSQTTSKDWNTNVVTTTFTDVNPHRGVICLHCAHTKSRGKRIAGLVLLIGGGVVCSISTLVGLVLANLAEDSGGDVGAAMGLPMAVMCVFFLLAIVGLVILKGGSSLAPGRTYTQEHLFPIFMQRLSKEYPPVRMIYLSPEQVRQMKRN